MTTDKHHPKFRSLLDYLALIPSMQTNDTEWGGFGTGEGESGWWVKFSLDIEHETAWQAVQELGYVLNELSLMERLPTVFKPVSPPPYLNGGPHDFLSWVIECDDPNFPPGTVQKWLEGRLPRPVDDLDEWLVDE